MDEVKGKAKVLMKKIKNPFSSSSRFKGEGQRLGSSEVESSALKSSTSDQRQQQDAWRRSQQERWEAGKQLKGDKFKSQSRPDGGTTPPPVAHRKAEAPPGAAPAQVEDSGVDAEAQEEMEMAVATFLSGGASNAAVEVLVRLLANIIKEPRSDKFRRVRMGNPKIQQTVGSAAGGEEFLNFLGFSVEENDDWRVMQEPSAQQLQMLKEALTALETHLTDTSAVPSFDRQVRVFYVSAEDATPLAELPAAFYELSFDEVKKQAADKRKKLQDSQLLVPKSLREKQALAARDKYKVSVIRVQFPDNVLLQGLFLPREPISAIHKFVKSSLKNQVDFKLVDPAAATTIISSNSDTTLDAANLVPTAILKFQTDATEFSGLRSDYLARLEPLTPLPF